MEIFTRVGDANPYVVTDVPGAMAPGAQTLYQMANNLLELARNKFAEKGLLPPTKQYIYMAPIPADSEALVVTFGGWVQFPPPVGPQMDESFRWMADLTLIVTRCTPSMPPKGANQPTVKATNMSQAALVSSQDADVMLDVLAALGEYGAASIAAQAPMGGLQTVELQVQVPIGGLG